MCVCPVPFAVVEVWSPSEYASLFLGTAEELSSYRDYLISSGVVSLTNGLLLGSKTRGNSEEVVEIPKLWHGLVDSAAETESAVLNAVRRFEGVPLRDGEVFV